MSYNYAEASIEEGKPFALYEFAMGGKAWRYTSANRDIIATYPNSENEDEDFEYIASAVGDEGIHQGRASGGGDDFTVNLQADAPFCELFIGTPPSEIIWLTVRRMHWGSPEAPVVWIGTVAECQRKDIASCAIICKTLTTSFRREGLRLAYERNCPHMLYDKGCRLLAADFAVEGVIGFVTGERTSVLIEGPPANALAGGFMEWDIGDDTWLRRAIDHVEDDGGGVYQIFFIGGTDGMEVDQNIKVYPGCDRTIGGGCSTFGNTANFGGFPHIPGKSPFDGTPVF